MGRSTDIYNSVRRRLLPGVHGVLDVLIGGYALSDTPPEEYVGTLECSTSEAEELLATLGFSRNVVASLKVRVDGNVSDGSWVYRESLFADYQLHVTIHRAESGIQTYAHWEYSSIRHPYRHYLAREYSAETGVRMMRSVLERSENRSGISWNITASYRRYTWYISLLRTVSEPLARRVADVSDRFKGGLTEGKSGIFQRISTTLRR
ncbi:hypothetical protein HUB97_13785 [Halorubraceae archaeon YAN]|nr:hypothetical protein [Halorubraceae archaeon YAN]